MMMNGLIKDEDAKMVNVGFIAKSIEDVIEQYYARAFDRISEYDDLDMESSDMEKENEAAYDDYIVVKEAMNLLIGIIGHNRTVAERPELHLVERTVPEAPITYVNEEKALEPDAPFPMQIPQEKEVLVTSGHISKEQYADLANLNNKLKFMARNEDMKERYGNFTDIEKNCNELAKKLKASGVQLAFKRREDGRPVSVTGCPIKK